MSDTTNLSLDTVPIDIVYKILDHLNVLNVIASMRNVCARLNAIVDSYQQYQASRFHTLKAAYHLIFFLSYSNKLLSD